MNSGVQRGQLSSASNSYASASAGTSGNFGTPSNSIDEIARVFNSALVATRASDNRNAASELHSIMESAPFRMILSAVRQLARNQGISERQAAEQMIRAFRKVDQIWADYVYQEGVDRLRGQLNP